MTDKKEQLIKLYSEFIRLQNKQIRQMKWFKKQRITNPKKILKYAFKTVAGAVKIKMLWVEIKTVESQPLKKFPSGGFVSEREEPNGIPARLSPERVIMYKPTEIVSEVINNMTYKVIK